MTKFVVQYYSPAEAMAKMATATEEEKMEGMKPWMAWNEKYKDNILDLGAPMMGVARIESDGSQTQAVGAATGFTIIQAENLDEAKAMMDGHPHLGWAPGCAIELYECMEM